MNNTPKLTKGMVNCFEDLKPKQHCVIVPVCEVSYPIHNHVEVYGLELFLKKIEKLRLN